MKWLRACVPADGSLGRGRCWIRSVTVNVCHFYTQQSNIESMHIFKKADTLKIGILKAVVGFLSGIFSPNRDDF